MELASRYPSTVQIISGEAKVKVMCLAAERSRGLVPKKGNVTPATPCGPGICCARHKFRPRYPSVAILGPQMDSLPWMGFAGSSVLPIESPSLLVPSRVEDILCPLRACWLCSTAETDEADVATKLCGVVCVCAKSHASEAV